MPRHRLEDPLHVRRDVMLLQVRHGHGVHLLAEGPLQISQPVVSAPHLIVIPDLAAYFVMRITQPVEAEANNDLALVPLLQVTQLIDHKVRQRTVRRDVNDTCIKTLNDLCQVFAQERLAPADVEPE